VTAAEVLRIINERCGTRFTLSGAHRGGEQGAWRIVDDTGTPLVLKWSQSGEFRMRVALAAETTTRLRAAGYPAPAYRLAGDLAEFAYCVQETLPGEPIGNRVEAYLSRILELNELQAGRGSGPSAEWPARVIDSLTAGCDGYCVPETLRTHSVESRELLRRLQSIGDEHAHECLEAHDVVHWDFHTGNILVDGPRVGAVIDWEGTGTGDRSFDLMTLMFYTYDLEEVRARLWRRALEQSARGPLLVYLAHMILRQIDWTIRNHDRAIIKYYFNLAERIIDACGR
jgi:hypothetical protein